MRERKQLCVDTMLARPCTNSQALRATTHWIITTQLQLYTAQHLTFTWQEHTLPGLSSTGMMSSSPYMPKEAKKLPIMVMHAPAISVFMLWWWFTSWWCAKIDHRTTSTAHQSAIIPDRRVQACTVECVCKFCRVKAAHKLIKVVGNDCP